MSKDYRVNTFGLTDEENTLVEESLPTRAYELYIADTPTDVIAIGCDAMIVNAIALDQDSADMIFDLYSQIDGCTNETVIWLGEPKPPKELRKFFKCYDSFDAIKDKLKYLLLTAHSKSKKAHEYSEKLVNGLKILALIRKHPGISTQKLSELTELPLRSVQRYIAALGRDNAVNVDTTRKQIYPRSTREHIYRFYISIETEETTLILIPMTPYCSSSSTE